MKDVVLNFMEVFMKMKKLFAMIMALTMLLFSNTQIFAKNEMVVSTSSNPDTLAQEVDKYVEDHLEELFENAARSRSCEKTFATVIDDEGNEIESEGDNNDEFSNMLLKLQGDTNSNKLLDVTLEADEEKPEFVPIASQNYDKEFTVTDASVVERIYSAYGQEPWYCIRIGKVGFSGDILEDAFEYYNSIVNKQQRLIERTFERIFKYWYEIANTSNDFSVEPLKYVRNATSNNNK